MFLKCVLIVFCDFCVLFQDCYIPLKKENTCINVGNLKKQCWKQWDMNLVFHLIKSVEAQIYILVNYLINWCLLHTFREKYTYTSSKNQSIYYFVGLNIERYTCKYKYLSMMKIYVMLDLDLWRSNSSIITPTIKWIWNITMLNKYRGNI